ncbi:MAG: putative transcriptional regulator [Zhongshania sp.]|jgi:putative transcriptional regulator
MSRIEHHPDEATITSYAAGSLPAALALVVGCHLQYCPECRNSLAVGEVLGGSLMAGLAPQSLSTSARQNMLDRLSKQPGFSLAAEQNTDRPNQAEEPSRQLPRLLHRYFDQDKLKDLPWKRTLAPGLREVVVDCGEGNVRLLRIAAGRKMPVHSHQGNELTLILSGGYSDALGQFNAGDVADLDGSVEHQPVADADEDCICLAGMDAPLVFKGWMARLIQPLVGF